MGMLTFSRVSRRVWREARYIFLINYHLKNGASVWLRDKCQKPLPPIRFQSGFTWHHGKRDQPIMLFKEIFLDEFYEPLDAPPNAVVFDIGANIGAVTMLWAHNRPDIRFHAYEPNPETFTMLSKNIEANALSPQVTAYPEAIGGTRGKLDLWVDVPTPLATAYGDAPFIGARKLAVPMITLDDAWVRIGRPPIWMLKIDVEGGEGDILEAASDELLANVQTACIEWHDNIVPGVSDRCRTQFEKAGFHFHTRTHPWDEGIFFATNTA